MKLLIFFLIAVGALRAQMIVADPVLTTVANQQLARLIQVNVQLAEANRVLALWWASEGDAKVAVARIEEMSSYVTNVGRMGAPRYQADAMAARVRMPEAMNRSDNPFRTELGRTLNTFGGRYSRDPDLYAPHLRWEGAVSGARELFEINRAHQHAILGYLSTANQRLETARTTTQLLAAQAEIERLQTLLSGAAAVGANLYHDVELKQQEWNLARRDEAVRAREEQALRARLVAEQMKTERRQWRQTRKRALEVGQAVAWPGQEGRR